MLEVNGESQYRLSSSLIEYVWSWCGCERGSAGGGRLWCDLRELLDAIKSVSWAHLIIAVHGKKIADFS